MRLPTAAEMRARNRGIRSSSKAQSTIDLLRSTRIALVLSGGGGKGAYEIGCLRALRDHGISRFCAVAGTSVGALNGALFTQDGLGAAKRVWHDISFGQVLKAHPFGFFVAFACRLLLAPMFALRSIPSFWEATEAFGAFKKAGFPGPVAAANAVSRLAVSFLIFAATLVAATAIVHSITPMRIPFVGDWRFWLGALLAMGPLMALWWGLFKIHNVVADRFALFSNAPLQSLVNRVLEPRKIRAAAFPTYITVAWLRWVQIPPGQERAGVLHSLVNYRMQYTPVYKELRELTDEGIREHVIQSAGLPEVFPRRVVSGVPVVDGGVADNTPFRPVLDADGFVVVYLQSHADKKELMRVETERVRRIVDQSGAVSDTQAAMTAGIWAMAKQEGWVEEVLRSESDVARPLLSIVPSRSLGGLLAGTMNFSACKARQLMWLGYWDTLGALEEGTMNWFGRKTTQGESPERDEVLRLARAAADGDAAAQFDLAVRYDRGRGVGADPIEATRLFAKAAESGHSAATAALATRYLSGLGVPRNSAEGLRLLRSAAEAGDANAQSTLGMIYATGQGVPVDYSEGVKWLRASAEQGNPVGLTGLGQSHAIGAGVATDRVEAYRLYVLALRKYERGSGKLMQVGASDVRARMKELASTMTAQQIADAEQRAG
jgi:predicted acylesterase/phospholipase RssA